MPVMAERAATCSLLVLSDASPLPTGIHHLSTGVLVHHLQDSPAARVTATASDARKLDHKTFQSFIDDKDLDRGRSFSGLLGLKRYSELRLRRRFRDRKVTALQAQM
jgi:hypothetical protein